VLWGGNGRRSTCRRGHKGPAEPDRLGKGLVKERITVCSHQLW
jgi:hypothetical protein